MSKNKFMGFGKANKAEPKLGDDDFAMDIAGEDNEEKQEHFEMDIPAVPQPISPPTAVAAPTIAFPKHDYVAPPMTSSDDDAIVSKGMNVTGDMNIESGNLFVYGVVKGEVTAEGVITIDGGQIIGNIKCKGLQMKNHAYVKGTVTISEGKNGNVKVEDGNIDGDVLGAHNLDIDEKSKIMGIVEATNTVNINGCVSGDHIKAGRLSFGERSNINASVQAHSMSVATGAAINGSISIVKAGG